MSLVVILLLLQLLPSLALWISWWLESLFRLCNLRNLRILITLRRPQILEKLLTCSPWEVSTWIQ